jgi:serine/threonine protein kinase
METRTLLRIRTTRWNPQRFTELGRGGEAVVYQLRPDTVAKVFLLPTAPEYADSPELQAAARVRIREMQTKLDAFPRDLPPEVVAPTGCLVNAKRQVFGYVMPLINGVSLDQLSRTTSIGTPKALEIVLTKLHDTVVALHTKGVVIGDFNENNVIVAKATPHLIDADAMQFGEYQCRTFMPRFAAPELVAVERPTERSRAPDGRFRSTRTASPSWRLIASHTETTDWYSFLVIAMRLLTRTDPYGGVVDKMDLFQRIEQRVTVFDPRVTYPAIARPLASVPRPILETLFRAFHRGERFIPDRTLFEKITFGQTTQDSATKRTTKRRTRHVQPQQPG